MTPYPIYVRPNNLPPELVFETRRWDLELAIDVVTMAEFKKIYKSVFEKITSEISRNQNITKSKLFVYRT